MNATAAADHITLRSDDLDMPSHRITQDFVLGCAAYEAMTQGGWVPVTYVGPIGDVLNAILANNDGGPDICLHAKQLRRGEYHVRAKMDEEPGESLFELRITLLGKGND